MEPTPQSQPPLSTDPLAFRYKVTCELRPSQTRRSSGSSVYQLSEAATPRSEECGCFLPENDADARCWLGCHCVIDLGRLYLTARVQYPTSQPPQSHARLLSLRGYQPGKAYTLSYPMPVAHLLILHPQTPATCRSCHDGKMHKFRIGITMSVLVVVLNGNCMCSIQLWTTILIRHHPCCCCWRRNLIPTKPG